MLWKAAKMLEESSNECVILFRKQINYNTIQQQQRITIIIILYFPPKHVSCYNKTADCRQSLTMGYLLDMASWRQCYQMCDVFALVQYDIVHEYDRTMMYRPIHMLFKI